MKLSGGEAVLLGYVSVVVYWCAAVGDSASVVEALLFPEFEGNMDLRFWLFNKLERLGKRIIVIRWNLESCYVQRCCKPCCGILVSNCRSCWK